MKTMNNMALIEKGEGRRDFLKKAFMMGAVLLTANMSVFAFDGTGDVYPDDKKKNGRKAGKGNDYAPGRTETQRPGPGVRRFPDDDRYNPSRSRIQTPVEIQIFQGDEKDSKLHKIERKVEKVLEKNFRSDYQEGMFRISVNHTPGMDNRRTGKGDRESAYIIIRRRGLLGMGSQLTLGRAEIESNRFDEHLLSALDRIYPRNEPGYDNRNERRYLDNVRYF